MKILKNAFKIIGSLICGLAIIFSVVSCKSFEAKLTLTADKTLVFPTETVQFSTVIETNKKGEYTEYYEIISGNELASITDKGVLTVSEDATNGGTVVVVSKLEEFKSNNVAVEIGINVASVTARTSKTTLNSGNAVSLNADVLPANATYPDVTWEVVEGKDLCVLSGNVLIVNDNVGNDKVIKVKAVADGVSSNVLTFNINPFVLDVNLVLSSDKAKAYAGDVVQFTTNVKANSEDYDPVTYEIIEGKDLATITNDGKLSINSTSNSGGKVVVVSKSGGFTSNEVEIALGVKATSVTASSASYNVAPGTPVTLNSVVLPANADNKTVTWSITKGSDLGEIVGNVLIVNSDIEEVSTIKVQATCGSIHSNELEFTITPKVKDVNLALTADKTSAYPNEVINLTTTHDSKDDISSLITYEIKEGGNLATVSNDGKVTINASSIHGGKIVVVSKYNNFVSNEIEININIRVASVTVSANKTELASGNAITLSSAIHPIDATNKELTWTILEGEGICQINGNVLIVNDEINELGTIKVKATVDGVDSNVLTFTVNPDIKEINLVLSSDKQLAFPTESVQFTTVVKAEDEVTDPVVYEIIEGAELATIDNNGKLTIKDTATTGGTVVVVSKCGDAISNEIEIKVGINVTSVGLTASRYDVTNGNAITLTATVLPANATNQTVTYTIVEGSELCELLGNVIIINDDIEEAGTIVVKASAGGVDSETITLNVVPPVIELKLTLSADKTSARPGEDVQFSTSVSPVGTYDVEYYFVSGEDLATIDSNGKLTIKDTSKTGGTVVIASKVGDFTSNLVGVELIIEVESVTISAQKDSLLAGNSLPLTTVIAPSDATNQTITWSIVQGEDLAHMVGNVFFVNEGTKSGSAIKVQATVDGVESNVLTFIVDRTQEEINKEKLRIQLNNDTLSVDKYGSTTPVLEAKIYDANFDEVTDKNIVYEIISGSEYITLNQTDNTCSFAVIGHGSAEVQATIEGTTISKTAVVNAILPPTSLNIPEVFTQRSGYSYNFGKSEALLFEVTPVGNKVCDEFAVSFKDSNGKTGDEVATYDYENNKITFKSEGLVTVTVTSTSGSKLEATNSYTFNINNGINVHTFEELNKKVGTPNPNYNGEIINIVVLEKPTTDAYSYTYGYDLVPEIALQAKENQSVDDIFKNKGSILIQGKSVYINGNNHTIDGSQLRVLTEDELSLKGATKYNNQMYPILNIFPSETKVGTYQVNLYDLNIKTNSRIDFSTAEGEDLDGVKNLGVYGRGLCIGNSSHPARYYVDMKNINISDAYIGASFYHVVEGNVENLKVNNCFSNGVQCNASNITFTNLNLGKCGAAGIEIGQTNSAAAGYDFNEPQKVTFAGTITTSNYNDGQTVYFQNYSAAGIKVLDIVNLNVQQYAQYPEVLSNLRNEKGEYVFVAFTLCDFGTMQPNSSVVTYKNVDGAGIINAQDLTGVDTTHKFIELNIYYTDGKTIIGKALLYNINYAG